MTAFGLEQDPEQDVQHMADRVMAAATASAHRDPRRERRAIGELIATSSTPHGREALGWAVTSILHERIGLAWQRNWQPVDLDRLVARRHGPTERALLADAIAEHLAQYAPGTIDPQWWPQLEAMDSRSWWPAHRNHLLARGEREDWRALVTAAARLVATVWGVPTIEPMGPVPGTATPGQGPRPDVEPKILERVRQMLAKAESTTFEAEAETFTAAAQKLMARHSIDAALLSATNSGADSDGPGAQRLGVEAPYESQKVALLAEVAAANRCRAVWTKDLGYVTVVGHEEDRLAVETLFTSLLVQATSTLTQQGSRTDSFGRSRTASFRRSFLAAYAHRIGERLEEATATQVASVAGELGADGSGRGRELVPLLEQRRAAVDAAVDEMFTDLRAHRSSAISDAEGWYSGTTAADRASLTGSAGQVEDR